MVSYNPWRYRCCQHNISFGWPYFIDHMWLATRDNGIASVLFAPSSVKAPVGQGEVIRIHEETQYPFGDWIEFTMKLDAPVQFPFYIRIPGWCSKASILINGHPSGQSTSDSEYFLIDREWQNGDIIRVQFSMDIEVKSWPLWPNTVSIKRGPLWYSLQIKEKWDRFNGTDIWPAFQVTPDSPWNFGLLLENEQPIRVKYIRDLQSQPFDSEYAPIVLDAPARQIDQWKAEGHMIGKLPLDPIGTGQEERIELIPMGCTRLRLTVFPLLKE